MSDLPAAQGNEAERFRVFAESLGVTEGIRGHYDQDRHTITEISYMLDVAMPISVAILDQDMRYVFINSQTYNLFGFETSEVSVGSHLTDAHNTMKAKGLLDEELMETASLAPSLLSERSHEDADMRIMPLRDGRYMRLTRRKLANDYTVSIAEDVTDLMQMNGLLQEALKIGLSGYWIYDFDTKSYALSDSMSILFSKEKIRHFEKVGPLASIHPEDRPKYKDALATMVKTGDSFNVVHKLADVDDRLIFRSRGQLIRRPDGRPARLQCFCSDITRERRMMKEFEAAKDEAVAANVAKSQFLANMSHEIRTPMNGVLGMAELLAGSALDDRQREFVNVITRSATSLLTVINDILDFSKIEADALDLEIAPFSLRDIVSEVASLLSQKAAEKGIELIIDYPSQTPHSFLGDGTRVRQILTNLVGNSVKFTDSGHVLVKVESRDAEGGVKLSVIDTGIGIEPDKVDQVFDKFTQADNSTTRIYGGTGLGLSISRKLAQLMGGDLSASSVYGEGSTFTAELPLRRDRSAKPIVRNTAPLHGMRALVVDDIDINRRLLSEQLTGWGMQVRTAPDGVEALMALKKSHEPGEETFDIIVMDYLMPGVNGRELANMIHGQPVLDLPILMLSSCDERQTHDVRSLEGVDRYLVKPVREQALFDAVVALIYENGDRTREPANEARDEAPKATTPKAKEVVEILVAEDFPLNQDVVRLMLADTCYEPVIFDNGELAVKAYAEDPERFAAVLMDVSMPVMDGYTATAGIRNIEANGHARAPIIALTGHALTHEREKCIDAGMDDYLTKPVKQTELIGALDRWTGNATKMAVA